MLPSSGQALDLEMLTRSTSAPLLPQQVVAWEETRLAVLPSLLAPAKRQLAIGLDGLDLPQPTQAGHLFRSMFLRAGLGLHRREGVPDLLALTDSGEPEAVSVRPTIVRDDVLVPAGGVVTPPLAAAAPVTPPAALLDAHDPADPMLALDVPAAEPPAQVMAIESSMPSYEVLVSNHLVQVLVEAKAFGINGTWWPWGSGNMFYPETRILDMLVQQGVMLTRHDEFGDLQVAVVPQQIEWQMATCVQRPMLAVVAEADVQHSQSKLDIVAELHLCGWRALAGSAAPEHWALGSPLVYPRSAWRGSMWFFRALAMKEDILAKGVDRILYRLNDGYYQVLCKLPARRLESIAANHAHLHRYSSSQFLKMLKGYKLPSLAVLDGEVEAEEDEPDEAEALACDGLLALEDEDRLGAPEPDDMPEALLPPGDIRTSGRPVRVNDEVVVRFDNCSHSSGIQRAYVKCPEHLMCFRYRQVNLDDSSERLLAVLTNWYMVAPSKSREEHQDYIPQVDDPDEVDRLTSTLSWRYQD